MPTPLINVSNRLPVTISDAGVKKSSGGLVAALEGLDKAEYTLNWVGWPGGEVGPERRAEVERVLREEHGCTPIFLSAGEAEAHYEGLSNSSIWPLLHYMPDRFKYRAEWWEAYREVNRRFAERVLSMARGDEVVWVHDYQLMLLPAMLREANPRLRIGFFLHTPFPSYEVFRCHPNREDLVAGLLGADLVGFHTFNYLRHFRSCVLRLLGIETEITNVRHDGRTTALGVFPIGINAPKFEAELGSAAFAEEYGKLATTHEGMRVVLSVERMDYTKGILHRLDAIELFLGGCADVERVKFVFIAVPSREDVEEYKALREEIEFRVGRLNGKYATLHSSPIRFIYGSVNFSELCALYAQADACTVTPLIDGMNLVAKEYVACQREDGGRPPGVLILSEFAGAAEEMLGAVVVNPYDAPAGARAIAEALAMPADERRRRMRPMRERVGSFDARAWARAFIGDLSHRGAEVATPTDRDPGAAHERLARAVREGWRVALFLDYDGTLREIVRDPSAATPTPEIRALLDQLAKLANVDTTVISGRTPADLETFLGHYEAFGLVAEHGAELRRPRSREWERLEREGGAAAWKDPLGRILKLFADSTPGTFVEEKRTSLVWHYRRADPEFGDWKARQLVLELSAVAANAPVTVRQGRKIVEVTSSQVNKGAAVAFVLAQRPYDLALAAGDDVTDESMFQLAVEGPELLTVHVGDGEETRAAYVVPSPAVFRQFLRSAIGD